MSSERRPRPRPRDAGRSLLCGLFQRMDSIVKDIILTVKNITKRYTRQLISKTTQNTFKQKHSRDTNNENKENIKNLSTNSNFKISKRRWRRTAGRTHDGQTFCQQKTDIFPNVFVLRYGEIAHLLRLI